LIKWSIVTNGFLLIYLSVRILISLWWLLFVIHHDMKTIWRLKINRNVLRFEYFVHSKMTSLVLLWLYGLLMLLNVFDNNLDRIRSLELADLRLDLRRGDPVKRLSKTKHRYLQSNTIEIMILLCSLTGWYTSKYIECNKWRLGLINFILHVNMIKCL